MPDLIDPPAPPAPPEPPAPSLPDVGLQLQAATDTALTTLCITLGLLVPGEGGVLPAPGVLYSHIGAGYLPDGTKLVGRFAFVNINPNTFGIDATDALLLAAEPHRYTGPDLRAMLGGSNYNPDAAVPQAVPMAEARKALILSGRFGANEADMDAAVRAALAQIQDPTKRAFALSDWEFQTMVRRDSPLVLAASEALGLTAEELDSLFVAARDL